MKRLEEEPVALAELEPRASAEEKSAEGSPALAWAQRNVGSEWVCAFRSASA
jgi:hypothetical protein